MAERQRCARDSDWCDGLICHEWGGCPNADPDTHIEGLKSTCKRRPECGCSVECRDYLARLRTADVAAITTTRGDDDV